MNDNIEKLYSIAKKKKRRILGLMSGTSLDGLDIALCCIKGSGRKTKVEVEKFTTMPFNDDLKREVRQVFSKKTVDLQQLCLLNEWLGNQYASMIQGCLKKWKLHKKEIDIIASHGQTVYHAPKKLH